MSTQPSQGLLEWSSLDLGLQHVTRLPESPVYFLFAHEGKDKFKGKKKNTKKHKKTKGNCE